jgi:hypothetical protein
VNIFSGNDAKVRAVEYAAWKYGFTYSEGARSASE